ncbi:MAG: ABC transporter permease [Chloroflexi bacterium]|nr:MAG: ABC transporter permease [Chloroflexota bacterium]
MSQNAAIAIDALSNAGMKPGSNWAMRTRRVARRQPLGVLAVVILGVLSACALFAPVVSGGADPLSMNATQVMRPPSAAHVMGTDDLGRDVFSRILYGARISLWVGFISVGISIGVGAPAGMISAYAGKWVDFGIQRIVDAMFAFPTIILALAIVSVLGAGIIQVTVAVGIVGIPRIARVARASTLGVMAQPYLEATTAMGASTPRVVFLHILPNILAPLIVLGTAGFGVAILAEASLSFLGVGTPAPQPSWGTMLSGGAQQYVRNAPYLAIFPGLAISFAVFGFNMLGDSLRDILDPRLRGS